MREMVRWLIGVLFVVAGCGDPGGDEPRGPSPWPLAVFPGPPDSMQGVPEERIELGRMLFYDPILSVDYETACATCHSELWGMGDGLPRGIGNGAGLGAGPRRDGPNRLRRNSPSIYNLAWRQSFLWDGRVETLEEQAIMPIVDRLELGSDVNAVVADLAAVPAYVELFAKAFPEEPEVTIENNVRLEMQVGAETPLDFIEFLKSLEGSDIFGAPDVRGYSPPNDNEPYFRYELMVSYEQQL